MADLIGTVVGKGPKCHCQLVAVSVGQCVLGREKKSFVSGGTKRIGNSVRFYLGPTMFLWLLVLVSFRNG